MTKEMRKIFALVIFGLILASLISTFAIAQSTSTFTSGLKDFVSSLRDPINEFTANTVLFVRTLFFILVFLIISAVTSNIPLLAERKGTKFIFSLIVTILSVYFIPVELVQAMLNPYSALGVALISIIPFVLMFMFTRTMLTNPFLQKVCWMFFAVTLLGMSVYTAVNSLSQGKSAIYQWAYAIASILALAMVFFSDFIDKHIHIGAMEAKLTIAEERMQKRMAIDRIKEQDFDQTVKA